MIDNLSKVQRVREYLKRCYDIRRNLLTKNIEYRAAGTNEQWKVLDEPDINTIFCELDDRNLRASKSLITIVLNSRETPDVNPIYEYLENLGSARSEKHMRLLFETLSFSPVPCGISKDVAKRFSGDLHEAYYQMFRRWLIAACKTAYSPDTANQVCLVLVGPQRAGKSTWLNRLLPPDMRHLSYVGHIEPKLESGMTANYLAEKWLINIDDQLDGLLAKDHNSLKSLITIDWITNRKAYAANESRRPRIASFIASVNTQDFLTDTDNRRYLCLPVSGCEFQAMPDMNRVWAEAYTLSKSRKETPYFTRDEAYAQSVLNVNFTESSPEHEWLNRCFIPCDKADPLAVFLSAGELLTLLQNYSCLRNLGVKAVGRALKRSGFERVMGRDPRTPQRPPYYGFWVRNIRDDGEKWALSY